MAALAPGILGLPTLKQQPFVIPLCSQASCEADLAAAEPLVAQAEAALDTLNKKDLGETKSLKKPPPGGH